MNEMHDPLIFADEQSYDTIPELTAHEASTWKVLIVDDEEEIHAVTRMVLGDFQFAGRSLEFISAHSGQEARGLLRQQHDIAIALIDVVMEEEQAGLHLVKFIREELHDPFMRIILRTGQPGQAPERKVVQEYDINDYKEKTELTAQKLFSCVYTALGNYRALTSLEANRLGLIKVIEGSTDILSKNTIGTFIQGVLEQVISLLFLDKNSVFVRNLGIAANPQENQQAILAATGEHIKFIGIDPRQVLSPDINQNIQRALTEQKSHMDKHSFTGYLKTSSTNAAVIFVSSAEGLTPPDFSLLEIFMRHISIGLENLHLHKAIEASQREIVYILSDAVESRSNETANHVRRVAEMTSTLARLSGFEEAEIDILYTAAPLHDIGKIGIPDAILMKADRLNAEEMLIMKTHTELGAQILQRSQQPVLQAAAIIAKQHHENWDSSGYPRGLSGEEIHINARLVAIADVFDALGSRRCYKEPWSLDQIVAYMQAQRGVKFDPRLIDLLLNNLDLFTQIQLRYPD